MLNESLNFNFVSKRSLTYSTFLKIHELVRHNENINLLLDTKFYLMSSRFVD